MSVMEHLEEPQKAQKLGDALILIGIVRNLPFKKGSFCFDEALAKAEGEKPF